MAEPLPIDVRLMNATASVIYTLFAVGVVLTLVVWIANRPAFAIQAIGETHAFAQAIDDPQLSQDGARHDHVEAVRAQIYGGQDIAILRWHIGRTVGGSGSIQAAGLLWGATVRTPAQPTNMLP